MPSSTVSNQPEPAARSVPARRATGLVVLTAIAYALAPLLIDLAGSNSNPFFFNALIQFGWMLAVLAYLRSRYSSAFNRLSLKLVLGLPRGLIIRDAQLASSGSEHHGFRLNTWFILMMLATANYALFVWSFAYIDAVISTTIYELWPMVLMATFAYFGRYRRRRKGHVLSGPNYAVIDGYHMTRLHLFLSGTLVIGLFFVIQGHHGSIDFSRYTSFDSGMFGILLALTSVILAGIQPATNILYGAMLHDNLDARLANEAADAEDETSVPQYENETITDDLRQDRSVWYTMFGMFIASLTNIPFSIIVGFVVDQDNHVEFTDGLVAFAIGFVLFGVGAIAHRIASNITSEVRIHASLYLTPVLALILLAVFTSVEVARVDYFLLGASLTTALIFLIQADPERGIASSHTASERHVGQRLGFVSLVLAVWFSGTMIYLRDDIVEESWLSWSAGDYWAVLALSATVFALILGFRVSRLSSRIDKEDEAMLTIFRRAELLVSIGAVDSSILQHLTALDRAKPSAVTRVQTASGAKRVSSLENAYGLVQDELCRAKNRECYADAKQLFTEITALEAEIDIVTNSKQQGRDFAELVSLMVFAIITIVLGIATRPAGLLEPGAEWQGLLTEVFSVLFVSTIAFLAINLFDIRAKRDLPLVGSGSPTLATAAISRDGVETQEPETGIPPRTGLHFRHGDNVRFQRRVSLGVTVFVCITFIYLLYDKWI